MFNSLTIPVSRGNCHPLLICRVKQTLPYKEITFDRTQKDLVISLSYELDDLLHRIKLRYCTGQNRPHTDEQKINKTSAL